MKGMRVRKNESKGYNNRAGYMQFISISVPRPKNEKRITTEKNLSSIVFFVYGTYTERILNVYWMTISITHFYRLSLPLRSAVVYLLVTQNRLIGW